MWKWAATSGNHDPDPSGLTLTRALRARRAPRARSVRKHLVRWTFGPKAENVPNSIPDVRTITLIVLQCDPRRACQTLGGTTGAAFYVRRTSTILWNALLEEQVRRARSVDGRLSTYKGGISNEKMGRNVRQRRARHGCFAWRAPCSALIPEPFACAACVSTWLGETEPSKQR